MAVEKTHYEIESVTGTVDERYIVLWVPEKFFNAATSTPRYTTLTNFMASKDIPKMDAIDQGFGTYILTGALPKANGCLRFIFNKDKTATEIATLVSTPYRRFESVEWPSELRYLYGVSGVERVTDTYSEPYQSPNYLGNGTADRLTKSRPFMRDRYELIPGGNYRTEVLVEEFFSHKPIPTQEEQMIPTVVAYNYATMQNSLVCLHDDIFVPELEQVTILQDFGTIRTQHSDFSGQFFPRTNYVSLPAQFVWRDILTERDGGFFRQRLTAFAPEFPQAAKF